MKLKILMMSAVLGLSGVALLGEAFAAPPNAVLAAKKKKRAHKKKGQGPTRIKKKLALSPKSIRFGMSLDELSKAYASQLDRDYVRLYKRVEPGPRMKELDAELADKKQRIKRNWIEFGNTPSGLDNGPLGGEFTYRNNEAMTKLTLRNGVTRNFFFINKRLWKIVDLHKLSSKSKLGSDYEEVVAKLTKKIGKKPRVREADPAENRLFESADWTDGSTILRIYNMGGNQVAILYVDENIEENLHKYRVNKADTGRQLDPDIAAITKD